MKKIHRQEVLVPFTEGTTYKTKFATGESFTITKLTKNKHDEVISIFGTYVNRPHLGACPIAIDRLIQPTEFTGVQFEVTQCPKCKHEFKD